MHYPRYAAGICDGCGRVPPEHDQVGSLAGLEGTDLTLEAERAGAVPGGNEEHLSRE